MNNFKQDEKQFLEYYIDNDAFPRPNDRQILNINKHGLELIIRPNCNQSCEYCYIYRHGKELYPNHNISKEELLDNVSAMLDYIYLDRRNYFYKIEFFAGDLFYDDLFFEIMEKYNKILKYLKRTYPYIFEKRTTIIIPSNLAFVYYEPEKAEKVKQLHDYFLKEYDLKLAFSWSTDGIYGTFDREKKELDEKYFDTILDFCFELDAGYHPMTSANNVKVLKQNYDWWVKKLKERMDAAGDSISVFDFAPSFLEVRNGHEWNDQIIDEYLDFLSYAMQYRYELCGCDSKRLAKHFYAPYDVLLEEKLPRTTSYDHLALNYTSNEEKSCENIPCGIQSELHLNCVDLSMVPCHRTAYPIFTGCYFKKDKETNKIVDVVPHNISGYYSIKYAHYNRLPVCSRCYYNKICLKGCLGAQYEYSGEIFLPIPSVCNLLKRKTDHLIKLYVDYGIFKNGIEMNYLGGDYKDWILEQVDRLGYDLKVENE